MPTTFCSTDLVRLLGAWGPAQPDDAGMDFAERLSVRLGPLDAIALQAATTQVRTARFAARRTPPALARKLHEDVDRVRQALGRAIAQDVEPFFEVQLPSMKGERARPPSVADAIGTGYQRRHAALQRQMEQLVAALRDHVRQALAGCSPRLQRLAVLDATLEKVLAAREQAGLARMARMLDQRLRSLRKQHDAPGDTTGPATWQQPGGWLHTYATEWRQALLAERDLRLHPTMGMVEAVAEEDNEEA